jgi:hypothetical protein
VVKSNQLKNIVLLPTTRGVNSGDDTAQQKTGHFLFANLNQLFFHRFSAANYDSVLSFFLARQVSEMDGSPQWILNESSKSTENALIEWLQKDTTNYFPKSKVYVVSLIISVVSKTGFGIILAHLVCIKSEKCRNARKLASACLKDNSDP